MLDAQPPRSSPWTWRSSLILVVVAALSYFARDTLDRRVPVDADAGTGWVTYDPDSLYHMRRVARALDEDGPIAGRDDFLNYPLGSAIPWPPYYTLFLSTLLGPFAPEVPGLPATAPGATRRQRWIERSVGSLPLLLGVLTSLLAAVAARRLAGDLAALAAGLYHALCLASIAYSKAGNGDHHAWVAWLAGGLIVLLSAALARRAHERPRTGLLWGSAMGALAGVLLGSWVASLVYILEVQLVLAWLILRNGRAHLRGLCAFGGAFHVVALLVSLPAVIASPWLADNPWQVVNLSWFQPAFLALGALVFLPLPLLRNRPRLRRAYPWTVLIGLLSTGVALATLDTPAGLGIREGFQWMSKVNQFMAGISESRPLGGARALTELGYGLLALPLIWAALIWKGRRGLDLALLPFLVCVPLRALQASRQARFGDGLSLPLAVLLGLGLAYVVTRLRSTHRPWRARMAYPLAGLLACLAHVSVVSSLGAALRGTRMPQVRREGPAYVAVRELCEWLRTTDHSQSRHSGAVLANWSWGHCIEWVAGRPSLATNFGSYVGEEGFRSAPRFLLSEDARQASELLEKHDAAFVLVTSHLTRTLSGQIAAADPQLRSHFLKVGAEGTDIRARWFETLGARLLLGGIAPQLDPTRAVPRPLNDLRLVRVSTVRDPSLTFPPGLSPRPGASPAGFLWEHVPGALATAQGPPGTRLTVELTVRFPRARYSLTFTDSSVADEHGRAQLRIPYATDSPTGNGVVPQELATFTFGARAGTLRISENAVLEGLEVRL